MSSSDKEIKVVKMARPVEPPRADDKEAEISREKGRAFLHGILLEIMDRPEDIAVTYSVGERTTIFKVECHPKSLGQLIGAKGKNISGIRAVISAMMARKGIRAIVEIPYIEPNE
ncbi:KH domain-containing protein [Bdellovibrio sp. NC01]|nr:KH domain-containing protein [Bdellovibrio sp. NC01]